MWVFGAPCKECSGYHDAEGELEHQWSVISVDELPPHIIYCEGCLGFHDLESRDQGAFIFGVTVVPLIAGSGGCGRTADDLRGHLARRCNECSSIHRHGPTNRILEDCTKCAEYLKDATQHPVKHDIEPTIGYSVDFPLEPHIPRMGKAPATPSTGRAAQGHPMQAPQSSHRDMHVRRGETPLNIPAQTRPAQTGTGVGGPCVLTDRTQRTKRPLTSNELRDLLPLVREGSKRQRNAAAQTRGGNGALLRQALQGSARIGANQQLHNDKHKHKHIGDEKIVSKTCSM
jgi:hypothetical protein